MGLGSFPAKCILKPLSAAGFVEPQRLYCYRDVVKNINTAGLLLKDSFQVGFAQTSGMPFQRVKQRLTQLKEMIPMPSVNMI